MSKKIPYFKIVSNFSLTKVKCPQHSFVSRVFDRPSLIILTFPASELDVETSSSGVWSLSNLHNCIKSKSVIPLCGVLYSTFAGDGDGVGVGVLFETFAVLGDAQDEVK